TAKTATMKPARVVGGRSEPDRAPRVEDRPEESDIGQPQSSHVRSPLLARPGLSVRPSTVEVVPLSGLRFDLLAKPRFLLSQLRREFLAEVIVLEEWTDLQLGPAVERCLLQPFHSLVHRLHLPDPEPGDELFRFGERPIDHRAILSGES